jgi:hypothetical protein
LTNFISRALCGTYATTFTAILIYFSGASSFAAIPMLSIAVFSDMHINLVRPDWAHERLNSRGWKRVTNPWLPLASNVIFFLTSILIAFVYSWTGSFCFDAVEDVVRIFFSTPHESLSKYGGLCGAPFGFISYIAMLWLILFTFLAVIHSRIVFHSDFARADARTRSVDFNPKKEIANPRFLVVATLVFFGSISAIIVSEFPNDSFARFGFFQPPIYISGFLYWFFLSCVNFLIIVALAKASGTLNVGDINDIHRQ